MSSVIWVSVFINNGQAWRRPAPRHLHRYKTNYISEYYDMCEGTTGDGVDKRSIPLEGGAFKPRRPKWDYTRNGIHPGANHDQCRPPKHLSRPSLDARARRGNQALHKEKEAAWRAVGHTGTGGHASRYAGASGRRRWNTRYHRR